MCAQRQDSHPRNNQQQRFQRGQETRNGNSHRTRYQQDGSNREPHLPYNQLKSHTTGNALSNTKNKNKQGVWESNQLKQAYASTTQVSETAAQNGGSALSNPDEIFVPGAQDYEFVFDENVHVDYDSGEMEEPLADNEEENTDDTDETQVENNLLPITKYKEKLLRAVKDNQVLIVVGETGSGKTTQLPKYLMQDLNYRVAVTQPRRVAATSVAARVAQEVGVPLGGKVGYSIRFDDKSDGLHTRLKYMTDGMLLREFVAKSELSEYDCIMIDEAHERTLATDILLGLLKERVLGTGAGEEEAADKRNTHRKRTKIIISSATINSERFSQYFNNAPIFHIPGKTFPVNIHYVLQPEANYVQASITTIFQIHLAQQRECKGDILVFLTGQEEIRLVQNSIEQICEKLNVSNMIVAPIFASLSNDQQLKIFRETPVNCRKVVLATNIAETSLTIDGIKYVIDPGYVKVKNYNPLTGMSELVVEQCSKASVNQRAGRAGRTSSGDCFRIFPKNTYENEMAELPEPEIKRSNLSSVVLLLISLGVKNLLKFELLDKPSVPALGAALDNLYMLGALNSKGQITNLGTIMNIMPCEPNFVKVMMVASQKFHCLNEILKVIAMLQETQNIFSELAGDSKKTDNKKNNDVSVFTNPEICESNGPIHSDHYLYLKIFEAWEKNKMSKAWCRNNKLQWKTMARVKNVYMQLKGNCERLGFYKLGGDVEDTNIPLEHKIVKCFIAGFPNHIVKLSNGGVYKKYAPTGGASLSAQSLPSLFMHPSCYFVKRQKITQQMPKPYKLVLYNQLLKTSKEFIKDCIPVFEEEWLHEMCPQMY
ncbi:hypothetical protein ACO0RG_003083 [Hanseniaspora osmophila]